MKQLIVKWDLDWICMLLQTSAILVNRIISQIEKQID